MAMRVFLTGINGFLGSHVAIKLAKAGHKVVGLVRNDFRKDVLSKIPIEYCQGDLRNDDSYIKEIKSCEVVIHTAALTQFGIYDKKKAFTVNTDSTKKLLLNSLNNGIKRFIYVSTRGTLNVAKKPSNSSEEDGYKNKKDMDIYFLSKFLAEKEVIRYSLKSKMNCIVLSPTAMIGKYDYRPSAIGQILLSYFKGKIKVYMDGGINIIDVEDVASVCVQSLKKGKNGEVYILGNKNILLYDLFKNISSIHPVKLPQIKLPYFVSYITAFLIEVMSRILKIDPFTTRKKVFSLYNNFSFCSSKKSKKEFQIENKELSETLNATVDWFCKKHDISRIK
tara:strand:+ start:2191 stop:3198 length:1008 start_codon:yes stop_codon:yes gene_type:complete